MIVEIVIGVVSAIVFGGLGWSLGRSGLEEVRTTSRAEGYAAGVAEADERIRTVAREVSRGRLPESTAAGNDPEAELQRALEKGWSPRGVELRQALDQAMRRVARFLEENVRAPLAGAGADADAGELRERIDRALGSLEDLEFYLEEIPTDTRAENVSSLVQQVTREFARDQDVPVRLRMDGPVRAPVNPEAFMDALYLLLHNAGRFGGHGNSVDVTVTAEEPRAVVRIRDHGPGFTQEAFEHAFDPFYSTTADGLGLGLPQVRKMIEAMGGTIELHNAPDGGGEVLIGIPTG